MSKTALIRFNLKRISKNAISNILRHIKDVITLTQLSIFISDIILIAAAN